MIVAKYVGRHFFIIQFIYWPFTTPIFIGTQEFWIEKTWQVLKVLFERRRVVQGLSGIVAKNKS
ncbi:MAG: hypothetical protein DRH12_11415 [Deltaproteobacteria bacterium]|nr:MAG: hypothetical protein DRH12_11415 [Deltaproteobacteria bacterium]